ncbi:hypothetical protein ACQW02_15590 [Humitalea sp. 24SJ18S-53]|uniref:hypothetical protein n=1 Tax=Humitalea sp. 24SJ18S-53 TaxID=3422307 RepID=UPI003D664CB3
MHFLLLLLVLLAPPALAQRGGAPIRPIPSEPAAAPPPAAELAITAAPSHTPPPRPIPPVVMAAGMEALPGGGWRLGGDAAARDRLDASVTAALAEIASHLAEQTTGRVTVIAEVAGPADDRSAARRASLVAARAVKRSLEAGGLDPTRIDMRPLGRTATPRSLVDVLPPGIQRDTPAAPPPRTPPPR